MFVCGNQSSGNISIYETSLLIACLFYLLQLFPVHIHNRRSTDVLRNLKCYNLKPSLDSLLKILKYFLCFAITHLTFDEFFYTCSFSSHVKIILNIIMYRTNYYKACNIVKRSVRNFMNESRQHPILVLSRVSA